MTSPREKKFKSVPSAAKIIVTVFWDDKGVTLVNFLPSGIAVNSGRYTETLRSTV